MQINKLILTILLLLINSSLLIADTHYISPTGNDTTGDGTEQNPWLTIHEGFSSMDGGDTLIIKDGTYTGTANVWGTWDFNGSVNANPPSGTPANWTIIKAEHDGMAIFDGEDTYTMCYIVGLENFYTQIEGIVWGNSIGGAGIYSCSYAKFLRCGHYDTGSGNNIGLNIGHANRYILMENCYTYGQGRYGFQVYQSTGCILRQCVARVDVQDCGGEPIGGIAMYSATDCEVQNCIVIDADQKQAWTRVGAWAGAFPCPATDASGGNLFFRQCVALNTDFGGYQTSGLAGTTNINFENCIGWNTRCSDDPINAAYGQSARFNQCTFGVQPTNNIFITSFDNNDTTFENNLVYYSTSCSVAMKDIETEGYNAFHEVAELYNMEYSNGQNMPISATDIIDVDFIWAVDNTTGALKYPVRTESGNSLATSGENGVQIGANALTLIGVSGTLYGETGYNIDTDVSMWPFPNENLIKQKMKAYMGTNTYNSEAVSGNRGFCADGKQLNGTDDITLTSYIWEYLGNQMPTDIYGTTTNTLNIRGLTIRGLTIQ